MVYKRGDVVTYVCDAEDFEIKPGDIGVVTRRLQGGIYELNIPVRPCPFRDNGCWHVRGDEIKLSEEVEMKS